MPTKIEWTDETWTPIRARNIETGGVGHFCVHVSPGCENCYAEGFQKRFNNPIRYAAQDASKVELFLDEKVLMKPLGWKKPRRVFVCSMTDLFYEGVPDEWIDRVFATMAMARQHQFQCLTKRSARMQSYITGGALQRVGALVYDARHGQRNNPSGQLPFRSRFHGPDMAGGEASRSRGEDGRWLSKGRADQPMQESSRRISAETRLSLGHGDNRREENRDGCSSVSLAPLQRTDSSRLNDQPQERREARQPAEEFGTGHDVGATEARPRGSEGKPQSSAREQTSQDETDRIRRDRNAAETGSWDDGQRHRHPVPDEPQGSLRNLSQKDLASHLTWPLPGVWLGVSVEDQQRADERIPILLDTPASLRFISAEPLLGPIDVPDCEWFGEGLIEWVICGGESGPNARPMHPGWARYLRDQCTFDGAAFFFKQWGEWADVSLNNFHKGDRWVESGTVYPDEHMRRIGKKRAGRTLDGRTWEEMPA